jgi:hypothetical protein
MPLRAREQITRVEAYRWYAESLRSIADRLRPSKSRSKLMSIADDFERMATTVERIARSKEGATKGDR